MSCRILQFSILFSLTSCVSCEKDSCICTINSEEETADCSHNYLRTIPACVPNITETLIFSDNKLKHSPKQFDRFRHLTHLDLSFNYGFQPDEFSFAGLSELKILNLETNYISTLSKRVFAGLHSLQKLSLSYNLLKRIRNYQFSELSNLTHLYLDNSRTKLRLFNRSLSGLHQLRYFSLQCTYDADVVVGLDTFKPLSSLEELHIEGWCHAPSLYYNCSNIDQILSGLPSLKRLHLDDILIDNLASGFADLKNLEELSFHRVHKVGCKVLILDDRTFDNLKNAKVSRLVLDSSLISIILPNTFACLKYLTSLELLLSMNYCNDAYVFESFATGLSNTPIRNIRLSVKCQGPPPSVRRLNGLRKTHLVSLDLSYGPLCVLEGSFFKNLPSSLQYLFLHHNQIYQISSKALSVFKRLNLVSLDLSNQQDLRNEYESLSTNSNGTYSILSELQAQNSSFDNDCYILPYSLKHIDVSNSSLLCHYMYNTCKSNNSLVSLKASYQRSLDCFGRFWNTLRNLPVLEEVDLSGNRIKNIPSWAFSQQKHLKYISLSKNVLMAISFDFQSSVLNYLDLSDNSIRYLSTLFTNNIGRIAENSNLTVHLGKNPLVCDCDRIKFAAWLRNTHYIYKKDNLTCKYENGTYTQLSNIIEIHNSLTVQCIVFDVTVACVVGFVALNILLGLSALIWHRRWQMRYLFSIARRNISPYHPLEDQEIQLEYDAYISYERDFNVSFNESLHQFVASKVYPALQRRGFNVLIRDELDIGMKLYDVISRAIRRSKKVVVFLSSDYCVDYWNVFEFNLAVTEGIYTKRQVVIPVAFENLRQNDLHDEVYAFLNAEPVPRYRRDMDDNRFINYLCERIKDDRNVE